MKIASWNVNSIRVRLPHILDWLHNAYPDVLALQETKIIDADFPVEAINELGYEVKFSGQKTYNGVAVLSKHGFDDEPVTDFAGFEDPQRRIMGVTIKGIHVLNLYVPNGSSIDSEKYVYKLEWLSHLHQHLTGVLDQHDKVVVLGDFNIAPTDEDVHNPKAWEGDVLVSDKERAALQGILDLGFYDSFRLFEHDEDNMYSWWDYRTAAFRGNRGLRIDLILTSKALMTKCLASYIDKSPREWERPSDHAPAVLECRYG